MYWSISLKNIIQGAAAVLIAAVFSGCQSADKANTDRKEHARYFDLPSYFQQEIDSLAKANPKINKTVMKDDKEETKQVHIKDWTTELSSFQSIDLNKPAYEGHIKTDTVDQVIQYSFTDPELDLSCVRIKMDPSGKPALISIEKHVKNTLYGTTEFLVYEKDSFYLVEKNQAVRVMGDNYYKVQGEF